MTGEGSLRYAEYKPSELEWCGSIPAHWSIQKTAWHFGAEKGRNAQLLTKEYCGTHEGPYPVYSGQTANDGVMGTIDSYEFDVGDNGVLFSTTVGAKAMCVSQLFGKFSLSQNCLIVSPRSQGFHLRFAYYAFVVLFRFERLLIPDHMQASFRIEDFCQYRVVSPPLDEQTQIARFLDYETAKIDRLIEKQQQLIELLKEKRQAVISHAVTKGLNPDAPMKDSGVEWLGKVPAHWEVSHPKHFTTNIIDGPHKTPNYVDDGVPFVTVKNLTEGEWIDLDDTKRISRSDHAEFIKRAHPRPGDILITKDGTLGVTRVVETDAEFSIFVSVALVQLRRELADPWFVRFAFESSGTWAQFDVLAAGAALKHIVLSTIANVKMPLPPLNEQQKISRAIRRRCEQVDALVRVSERRITLLQERRTALISAAVTGKIDVRGWKPPEGVDATEDVA